MTNMEHITTAKCNSSKLLSVPQRVFLSSSEVRFFSENRPIAKNSQSPNNFYFGLFRMGHRYVTFSYAGKNRAVEESILDL